MEQQKKIRVLIADDDRDFCFIQKSNLNLQPDIECCGMAYDGKTAIRMIAETKPDVVLLDHVMPMLDGLGVLEYAHEHPFAVPPRFLVSSANAQEHILRELMDCGADYFLEKPYDLDTLIRRIRFVYKLNNEAKPMTAESLEKVIAQRVMALGIPTKLFGYDYTRQAVYILITNHDTRPTLKQAYTVIAEQHGTDIRCVESAITSAIRVAMAHKTPGMRDLLSLSPVPVNDTLSNGKFLTLAVQSIRLEDR